jgi:hypothetical protein
VFATPDLIQRLAFGKSEREIAISNAYFSPERQIVYSNWPFRSTENLTADGDPTLDTPESTITISLAGSNRFDEESPPPDGPYNSPSGFQWVVDNSNRELGGGDGIFRVITTTIENSTDSYIAQLIDVLCFTALGFLLSELVVLVDERKRGAAVDSVET